MIGWIAVSIQAVLAVFAVWMNWLAFRRIGEIQMERQRIDRALGQLRQVERSVDTLIQRIQADMRDETLLRLRLENLRISRNGTRIRVQIGRHAIWIFRLPRAGTKRPDRSTQ